MKDSEIKLKTDEEIVEIVRNNNKEIYAYIVRRYQDKLIRYAEYLIGDYDKASDAVQQSLIKSYINLNSFDLKKNFSNWIYRIVHNESINLISKDKKTVNIDPNIDFESGEDIEDEYIKKELISNTRECLKNMDLIYREPLSLYYLEDKSYKEIGDILRIPVGTVSIRIKRAKIILKKICKEKIK
ncbi:sigma-70 family RNA polymerase sigma factor [Patescibacteria group bacterium]|nr:sigma-70 family RNA polymerase sigma factor [Patescibacteria group bacterium]